MQISDFSYELPEHLIAQEPLENRAGSRMLVINRATGLFTNEVFSDLPRFLRRGDVLVLNNTKVFPARLIGRSETGANIEIFLVEEREDLLWTTLARPSRRLKPGKHIKFGHALSAEVIEKTVDGKTIVKFCAKGDFFEVLDSIGRTPLPPYIKRGESDIDTDRDRYQTIFAANRGAIAAPTAGLHFTPEIVDNIRGTGVEIAEITLHVGYGTFEPVRADELSDHRVAPERFEIGQEAAASLNAARKDGRRIIAVGTTTTRALETAMRKNGRFIGESGSTDLTITPGYKFQAVSGLLTNFHLPQSSLLILVSTFGGYELIMEAYRHAVASQYRFYSYGDCMLIV